MPIYLHQVNLNFFAYKLKQIIIHRQIKGLQTMQRKKKSNFQSALKLIFATWKLLLLGLLSGKGLHYLKYLFKCLADAAKTTYHRINRALQELEGKRTQNLGMFSDSLLTKVQKTATDLHSLLPKDDRYVYSILILADPNDLELTRRSIESAERQSPPRKEIIVGFLTTPTRQIQAFLAEHKIEWMDSPLNQSAVLLNQMAEKAQGSMLILLEKDAWMRPDCLYRLEQYSRILPCHENYVIYPDEYRIDPLGDLIKDDSRLSTGDIHFPYYFSALSPACIMIPKKAWDKLGGLRTSLEGAHLYDLFLRLNLEGVPLKRMPFPLVASRDKLTNPSRAIDALQQYAEKKNLDWHIEEGSLNGTLRAIPQQNKHSLIHIIIPYKDHKAITLQGCKSALAQKGVDVVVTAVDNRSTDHSIANELENMGVEVLHIDEPFNFSRLNNLAVQRTIKGKHASLLFFMNNDVELDEHALVEMCRWIDQPHIGMVGCRYHYPNGLLQCGGIDYNNTRTPGNIYDCDQSEQFLPYEQLRLQRLLRVTDYIHGAGALIRRSDFETVGGFDEISYPNSFSDINLSMKIKARGLLSFYTPFANGVHHESLSRITDSLEDVDHSTWFFEENRKFVYESIRNA
jgi:GT2 family glycosyltransferase